MNTRKTTATRKRAATIVEVSTVVVCVMILAVWLIPAVASAGKGSKSARCLSQMARIGFANSMYTSEDPTDAALPVHRKQFDQCRVPEINGICPEPTHVGAYEWGGKSGIGRDDFATGKPGNPLGSKYGTWVGFAPASRPLNDILFPGELKDAFAGGSFDWIQADRDTRLELDIFRCPSDTGFTGIHCPSFEETGLSSFDHFGTSYNANIFMVMSRGGTLAPGFEASEMGSNSPYLHGLSEIRDPSRTLAYQENNGRFAWTTAPEITPACDFIGGGIPGTVRGWHGKDWTFNATFIDGHANSIHMRGYRNECEPSARGCQLCIRVRDEGWQVDTRPARFVRTKLIGPSSGRPSYEGCIGNGNELTRTVSETSTGKLR